ncbi:FHA domain-containing protein [bacterium]|nr:FHA domain-containing protein [bacterium]
MPIIRIKNGPHKGNEHEVKAETLVIGRDENPDGIQILDQGISRRHAEIFRIGEMYFIRDLGSRNGTFVNEEKISEELLRVGDEIKIGSTVLLFEDRRAKTKSKTSERVVADPKAFDAIAATTTISIDLNAAEAADLVLEPGQETQESRDLQVLYKVAKTIASERDLKGLARKVVRLAGAAVKADHGYIFIKHPEKGELTLGGSYEKTKDQSEAEPGSSDETTDPAPDAAGEGPMISRTIVKRVLRFGRAIMSSDASLDDRFRDRGSVVMKQIRSVICAPLVAMDQLCGVLYLSTSKIAEVFTTEDLELVTAIGVQAGMAIQGITLALAQEKNYLELVGSLVAAIEMRDPLSRGHSERVSTYASGIAQALGLSRSRNRRVQLAALLHNIGSIFLDPGELAKSDDIGIDKKRIDLAGKLLEKMHGMSFLLPAVKHHKERWDGKGYPDALAGEDIPLEARIIGVANDFDKLIESAAEKGEQLDTKDAVARLVSSGVSSYDPKVLEALMLAHREGWLYEPPERVKVG